VNGITQPQTTPVLIEIVAKAIVRVHHNVLGYQNNLNIVLAQENLNQVVTAQVVVRGIMVQQITLIVVIFLNILVMEKVLVHG